MLDAKKAREKVDFVLRADEIKELDIIMTQIEEAVANLKYTVIIENAISKYVCNKLDELGFKVQ